MLAIPTRQTNSENAGPIEAGETAARALHSDKAALAAAWCAFSARCDGRNEDYRFWLAVFIRLAPPSRSAEYRQKNHPF